MDGIKKKSKKKKFYPSNYINHYQKKKKKKSIVNFYWDRGRDIAGKSIKAIGLIRKMNFEKKKLETI
jgi:hypothetical protein